MYVENIVLAKKTFSDMVFKDAAYEIPLIFQYDGYHRGLAGKVNKILTRKQDQGW